MYAASQEGHTEVVDLLVQAGANIQFATIDEVHTQAFLCIVCVAH